MYRTLFMLQGICSRVRLKPDGTRWRTGGEVKGKLVNGVGSQYSHTTSERGVSSITNADAHTSAASSRLNRRPCRFKWTRPFRRKKNLVSAHVSSRFKRSLQPDVHTYIRKYYHCRILFILCQYSISSNIYTVWYSFVTLSTTTYSGTEVPSSDSHCSKTVQAKMPI
jgi:hypothetical protein